MGTDDRTADISWKKWWKNFPQTGSHVAGCRVPVRVCTAIQVLRFPQQLFLSGESLAVARPGMMSNTREPDFAELVCERKMSALSHPQTSGRTVRPARSVGGVGKEGFPARAGEQEIPPHNLSIAMQCRQTDRLTFSFSRGRPR